jgi:hypothetical protein
MTTAALLISLLALVLTKVADFVTTVKHVDTEAETNPLARRCFSLLGFKGGLWIVALLWLAIVVITFGYAWLVDDPLTRWLTALTGFGIAWAQWDAARFNRSGRASWFTRRALRFHQLCASFWRG